MTLRINSQFDSGNILVRSVDTDAKGDWHARLAIDTDAESDFLQWFHFEVSGMSGKCVHFSIENACDTTYPDGWEDFNVVCSSNCQDWQRCPSTYNGKSLDWTVDGDANIMRFAYFAPYSLERQAEFLGAVSDQAGVSYTSLGQTLDGRELNYLIIDKHPNDAREDKLPIWVVARQHPGESMASWWIEGWLDRLLDEDDASSRALRRKSIIHVMPNMNPDGSFRGHLRTNAVGSNLNREWVAPSMDKSPEVFLTLAEMDKTGVHLALDIHGDEALPYNFIAGTEGVPGWDERRDKQLIEFKQTVAALNPDFQTVHGYPRNRPGAANLSFCSNQLAERFNCLAMTLEMPFKDTKDTPRPSVGWSPERCQRLGASFVDAVYLALCDNLISSK